MSSLPEKPHGPDLAALRKEIDDLEKIPEDQLISRPVLADDTELLAAPAPTDAIGSETWKHPITAEGPDED